MREFVYYSQNAVTSGKLIGKNAMVGRLDIVCNVIIQTFFTSNNLRKDVRLHLVFDGPPYENRHLILDSSIGGDKMPFSKKDLLGLIKRMLYKCPKQKGKQFEIFPGCFIEIKSFEELLQELDKDKTLFHLERNGEDIRKIKIPENSTFIIGDHEGFPKQKKKFMRKIKTEKISISPEVLFASQVAIILNNEIDRQI